MATRKNYKAIINHERKDKKTSQSSKKGRVKLASMNKSKKNSYKPYNRQGKR
jgi:hypothetical protein